MRPRQWWAESAPLGWNRVKVSENLGVTAVAPIAPVDTSLLLLALCTSYLTKQFQSAVYCKREQILELPFEMMWWEGVKIA